MADTFHIWEGVYSSFLDAKAASVGPGFEGVVYKKRVLDAASQCLNALSHGNPIPRFHKQRSTMLPPLAAVMLDNRDRLSVLDFGGGLGIGYMTLLESIPLASEKIDYTIVEVDGVCDQGRQLFSTGVEFCCELPSNGYFNLVHSASALQYIEDWKGVLQRLCAQGADYLLLSDVFAGEIDTFATLQNYYDSKIPHWFLNLEELLSVVLAAGYRLDMKSHVNSRRLATNDVLPMENIPSEFQISETLHLLFRRCAG